MKRFALLLVVFALLPSMPQATDISTCQNLSSANTEYVLTTSPPTAAYTCFNVTAANVTLDCNGYNITGNNAWNTRGVYSTKNGTVVKNCVIKDFLFDIYYNALSNGTVTNCTLTTEAGDGAGVKFEDTTFSTINDTYAYSLYDYGIYLTSSSNNTISNVTAESNGTNGVLLTSYSNGNLVRNSTLKAGGSSTTSALLILSASKNNQILNSTLDSIYIGTVISHSGTTGNILTNVSVFATDTGYHFGTYAINNIVDCQGAPIRGNNTHSPVSSFGVRFDEGSSNIIRNCNISNWTHAIHVELTATNNTVANNTLSTESTAVMNFTGGNRNYVYRNNVSSISGILVDISNESYNNTFCWNNFTGGAFYLNDINGSNFYNSSLCNGEGNIYANLDSTNLTGTNLSIGFPDYKVATGGTAYPVNNSTNGKWVCSFQGCADFAPLFSAAVPPASPAIQSGGSSALPQAITLSSSFNCSAGTLSVSSSIPGLRIRLYSPAAGYLFADSDSSGAAYFTIAQDGAYTAESASTRYHCSALNMVLVLCPAPAAPVQQANQTPSPALNQTQPGNATQPSTPAQNGTQPTQSNCSSYDAESCPAKCVVCPPCAVCSSISCQTEEFCASIGFDRSWHESVKPKGQPGENGTELPLPPQTPSPSPGAQIPPAQQQAAAPAFTLFAIGGAALLVAAAIAGYLLFLRRKKNL